VEKVLRLSKETIFQTKHLNKNQRTLLQLIDYLKVNTTLLFEKDEGILSLIQENYPAINCAKMIHFEANKNYGNTLFISDPKQINEEAFHFLKQIKNQNNCSLYLTNIHQNEETELIWDEIRKLENFPLSLDFWEAGFLIQDNSFKIKQHFLLK